ncbi:MAG: 2-amino-4-ketopentanoate thiolase alpha subunit [Halanaerobiales bacterium]|nr:2-amino-4-ketopentanoate thiolase alpha subunit [Halanaerobiales bacterium]
MTEKIKAGTWVQIHQVILPAGERAPQVPDDTQEVPLELRVKGFLLDNGVVGEEVEIETYTGRRLSGILEDPHPSYEHKFGRPVHELLKIGRELRRILREKEV